VRLVPLLEAAHFGALSWAQDEVYLAPPQPLPIIAALPLPPLPKPSPSPSSTSNAAAPPPPPPPVPPRLLSTPLTFDPHRAYPLAPLPPAASGSSSSTASMARIRRSSLNIGATRTGASCRRPPPHALLAATGRFPSRPPAPSPTPAPLPLPPGAAYANALAAQEQQGFVKKPNTSSTTSTPPCTSARTGVGGLKSAASFSFGSSALAHSSSGGGGGSGDGADAGSSGSSGGGAPLLSAPPLPPLPTALATAKAMATKGSGPVQNGGLRDLRTACGGGLMSVAMADALMALDSTPNRHACTVSTIGQQRNS